MQGGIWGQEAPYGQCQIPSHRRVPSPSSKCSGLSLEPMPPPLWIRVQGHISHGQPGKSCWSCRWRGGWVFYSHLSTSLLSELGQFGLSMEKKISKHRNSSSLIPSWVTQWAKSLLWAPSKFVHASATCDIQHCDDKNTSVLFHLQLVCSFRTGTQSHTPLSL